MICSFYSVRAKLGRENAIREALLEIAELTRESEPGTHDLFLLQDEQDRCFFSMMGRFVDQAALDAHNSSDPMTRFLFFARDMLDGPMSRASGPELFAKCAAQQQT